MGSVSEYQNSTPKSLPNTAQSPSNGSNDGDNIGQSLPSPAMLTSRGSISQSNSRSNSQSGNQSFDSAMSPVSQRPEPSTQQNPESPSDQDLVSERSMSDHTHSRSQSQTVDERTPKNSSNQSDAKPKEFPSSPLSQPRSQLRHSLPMFRNQVAGHSPLFWHSGTICKPLIEQEYSFYADLDYELPDFARFVPKFYGVMDLERLTEEMANSIQQSSGGNEWESGNKDDSNSTNQQSKDDLSLPELNRSQSQNETSSDVDSRTQQSNNQLHKQSNSVDGWAAQAHARNSSNTPSDTDQQNKLTDTNAQAVTESTDQPASSDDQSVEKAMNHNNRLYNKWSMRCQLRKGSSRPSLQYIVLEDLSFAYSKPCILDLKIGTRQHADDERPSKIASKTARCLHTTSAALGLRVCGMQVYHADKQRYLFRDKYWGRSLDETTFYQAIKQFFWDGSRYLLPIIRTIRRRIETLNHSIQHSAQGRKFYSSSLLLIYEGDPECRSSSQSNTQSLPRHGSDFSLFSPLNSPQEKRTMSAGPRSIAQSLNRSNHPFLSVASDQSSAQSDKPSAIPSSLLDELNEVSLSSSVPKNHHSHLLDKQPTNQSINQSGDQRYSSLPADFAMPCTVATNANPPINQSISQFSNQINGQQQSQSAITSPSQLTHTLNQSLNPPTQTIQPINPTMSQTINQIIPPAPRTPSPRPLKLYVKKRKTTHAQAMAQSRARGNIDVRMIDFAHTSRNCDGARAQELDTSLLYGFASLIRILKQVEKEVEQEENGVIHENDEEDKGLMIAEAGESNR